MINGIIIKILANLCYVETKNDIYECEARGIFRKNKIIPTVGDNVEITILDENKKIGFIEKINERINCIIRPAIANINKIILVVSVKKPKSDLVLLDKQIAFAILNNIEPIICINKTDLDDKELSSNIEQIYKNIGYKVIKTQAVNNIGISEIEKIIDSNDICAFSGNSGVGKSTLINSMFGQDTMKEGQISEKISRGKHTTRHVELFKLPNGGYIADTPGFSTFDILETKSDNLVNLFSEFVPYIEYCEYRDCTHIKEKECGIKKALHEGKISSDRYDRFLKIYEELKQKEKNKY